MGTRWNNNGRLHDLLGAKQNLKLMARELTSVQKAKTKLLKV